MIASERLAIGRRAQEHDQLMQLDRLRGKGLCSAFGLHLRDGERILAERCGGQNQSKGCNEWLDGHG
ncbi:MAG: hypothetical protein K8H99_06965, partial [Nitrospirae bacterium]|nr:hypothetical protein [Fimbriimonadaceae bacterium]